MRIFFLFSWALAVSVALLPLAHFLVLGWKEREAEFIDKVHDRVPMDIYFKKFWLDGWTRYQERYRTRHDAGEVSPRRLFQTRYRRLMSRYYYILPGVLFLTLAGLLTGLVIATAMRTGYDHYVEYFSIEAKTESDAVRAGIITDNPITLPRIDIKNLDADFAPLPQIHLSLSALSAIAGAYLFIVAQLIQQCRARTLVYFDLFGASLRMLIAMPLGLSLSTLASDALGAFISFGLGAFPIIELRMLTRRLTATSLMAGDPRAAEDQTIAMLGVTESVSDTLAEENITCVQQLADIDPVVLAVRTGLSFDYILFLASQSLVWCFLGKTAAVLGPLGLADARAIWSLMAKPEDERKEVLASVDAHFATLATPQAPKSIDTVLLREAFEKIAADPYTLFLVDFASDLKNLRHDASVGMPVARAA